MRDNIAVKHIQVSAEHVSHSVSNDSHHCMIADAIQSQIKWAKYIIVDLQSIRFTNVKSGKRFIYLTPPEAQQAILAFDGGRKVAPFKVVLTQGYIRGMRVRDPGYTPDVSQSKRPKKKRQSKHIDTKRFMPSRYREFGVRKLTKPSKARTAGA